MTEILSPTKECGVKMYGTAVVGTKGQIVIPKDVREELGIVAGDSLIVLTKHGKAIGMVKTDDLEEFMEYMKREMETIKNMSKEDKNPLS